MIDFLRALRAHAAYKQRLVSFAPALIVSELFYKFHSFTLECLAFLATWLVFDVVAEWVAGKPVTSGLYQLEEYGEQRASTAVSPAATTEVPGARFVRGGVGAERPVVIREERPTSHAVERV